ncbi:DUF5625 family protein [Pseudomonas sp. FEN]|uniref:DUF5625 family protein n=1 Tax=Pseudomonas sp. FEN TaxID=2767468 RepID=UPI001CD76114|nr:DUF5625 family protein [Pseudomonas sp. FEN]
MKPIDISAPGQKVSTQFKVQKSGGYEFALLFVWGGSMSERDRQRELWYGRDSTPVPILLRIVKDGEVFFDEVVVTAGVQGGQSFDYAGQTKSVAIRVIKGFELMPGSYSVEVGTVEAIGVLKGIESFVSFAYSNQKI